MTEHLRNLSDFQFALVTAIAVVVALFCLYIYRRMLHHSHLAADTPTSKIRSASQGYLELVGEAYALPGEPIKAPLSGKACAWWAYRVEEREQRSRGGHGWRSVDSGVSDAIFGVRDATGTCIVDPDGAIVRTARRNTWTSDSRRRADGDKRRGFKTTLGSRYRYTERLIEIGDPLHAIGFLRSHDAAQGLTEAEELRALLAEWKRDQRGLIERFDSDGDREISVEEWDQAREQALEQVRRERADEPHLPRVPVLGHPQDQRPFLLAVGEQDSLTRRWRYAAFASGAGFVVSIGILAWLFAQRFGT